MGRIRKIFKVILCICLIIFVVKLICPTWTKKIKKEGSISELSKIKVNGTKIQLMIRGESVKNPVLLFVHGGPSNSEIPYVRKYQNLLEQSFVVVHYDQRGSGKSYRITENYDHISAEQHVEDLQKITDYLRERFKKDKIILAGHSYGTYLATLAASRYPEKYFTYIGIGQVSDPVKSECNGLEYCIRQAKKEKEWKDYKYLKSIRDDVKNQKIITPRKYIRKYHGASVKIDDTKDIITGLLIGPEYNWLNAIGYGIGALKTQPMLLKESKTHPLPELVTKLDLPFYFVMGEQDYMTSTAAAEQYFKTISCSYEHKMIVYPGCAHFPQFEEKEKFYKWIMKITRGYRN